MKILNGNKIVPVVVLNRAEDTEPVIRSLVNGGITVAEITFRTECAEQAIRIAVKEFPEASIGAGTVINADQCRRAIDAGAKFIVSPGFSKEVLDYCSSKNVPYIPGVATATEITAAVCCGLTTLKFFPAEALGGVKTLKALSAAFPGITFMPTGGINADNIADYLKLPFVAAAGGSWMMKGTPEQIEALTREAVRRVKEI